MRNGVVETGQGPVQGERDGRVWAWRGVPYAKPPLGPRRFRPAEAPDPWTGQRDATRFGPAALQQVPRLSRASLGAGIGEDCLRLNIWSPAADSRRRPVMVWVHGGAFVSGSGALYRGEPLAFGGDIVVVTLNYRLGVFGFVNFADTFGDEEIGRNLGLTDVIAALAWVKANIAAFGGDPDRVTVAGESAGSIIVSLLMLADSATPLFHQAIMQSGAFNLAHARDKSQEVAAAYVARLPKRPAGLADLQALPAPLLLDAQAAVARRLEGTSCAAPWFDGSLLPASHAEARIKPMPPIPLIAGGNRDEITLFKLTPGPNILRSARPALLALVRRDLSPAAAAHVERAYRDTTEGNRALGSDANFVLPTLHVAERQAAGGAPTWVYRFDYAHPLLRATHALELLFLWPYPGLFAATLRGGTLTGLRSGLSERMRAAWTSFVRTGSPGEDWPRFTLPARTTRLFGLQDRIVDDPMRHRREAWNGMDVEPGQR